jgi:predicted Kef-type K+ transport protein
MLKRLKRALVDSYVGAIALGYLLAESVLYFINFVAAPVTAWAQQQYRTGTSSHLGWADLVQVYAIDPLFKFIALLVFWYILLRWLYLERPKKESSAAIANREQA